MMVNPEVPGPAEAVADRELLPEYGRDPPLDLVHLARQCQGDHVLEDELLGLFRLQSLALAGQLSDPSNASLELKANLAHRLCGSALAVGASRVAGAARTVEERVTAARGCEPPCAEALGGLTSAILALDAAVAETVAEIEKFRG